MTGFRFNRFLMSAGFVLAVFWTLGPRPAEAGLIFTFLHNYDGGSVDIDLRVYDNQPGGRYLWEYTVTNTSYAGSFNGFSGFELFLPTPIPEIADITPNPASTPPWDINCCSGNPVEWDISDLVGLGVMPGNVGIFSFTTAPRQVAINDSGWFHTWDDGGQTFIISTPGMHVPWVPGLVPVPEPGSLLLMALAALWMGRARRG